MTVAGLNGCGALGTTRYERLVVFGDSNADNGNLFALTHGRIPSAPRWHGRESNGPVAVEYLATLLGATLEDHAVAGATTGYTNILPGVMPQMEMVAETGVQSQIGMFARKKALLTKRDLVVIWAGSNDLIGLARQPKEVFNARIAAIAANVEQALWRLKVAGASTIVVIGRTPRPELGSDDDLNGRDLNAALLATVRRFKEDTHADILFFDAYAAVADMMLHPGRFGFAEVRTACIAVNACVEGQRTSSGNVADTFVHWDRYHKTTRVHQLLALQIFERLKDRKPGDVVLSITSRPDQQALARWKCG